MCVRAREVSHFPSSRTSALTAQVAEVFPNATSLSVARDVGECITDDNLAYLERMLRLRVLDLSFCQRFTARGLGGVSSLQNLTTINMRHVVG